MAQTSLYLALKGLSMILKVKLIVKCALLDITVHPPLLTTPYLVVLVDTYVQKVLCTTISFHVHPEPSIHTIKGRAIQTVFNVLEVCIVKHLDYQMQLVFALLVTIAAVVAPCQYHFMSQPMWVESVQLVIIVPKAHLILLSVIQVCFVPVRV